MHPQVPATPDPNITYAGGMILGGRKQRLSTKRAKCSWTFCVSSSTLEAKIWPQLGSN